MLTTTTLAQSITGYTTKFYVASTANVLRPFYSSGTSSYLSCENELMFVTDIPTSGLVQVLRGVLGTSAVSHSNNTVVTVGLAADLPLFTAANEVANVTLTRPLPAFHNSALLRSVNKGGMYAVYLDVICTLAGTGGTVSVSVSWNNGTTAAGLSTTAFSLTSPAEQTVLFDNFVSAPNQTITYSTTVSGATGNPQYSLGIRMQYLG